ncbi:MAG: hypothetical protein SCJ93_03980, partial [Bacillota bacterium]|nr:hypothetical protein [Bacillota bacterium]
MKNLKKYTAVSLSMILVLLVMSSAAFAEVDKPEDRGFQMDTIVTLDGEDYSFIIPGHEWVVTGPNRLVGKHYNSGPMEKFWSS